MNGGGKYRESTLIGMVRSAEQLYGNKVTRENGVEPRRNGRNRMKAWKTNNGAKLAFKEGLGNCGCKTGKKKKVQQSLSCP